MTLFSITPVELVQSHATTHVERAMQVIGRRIDKLTHELIQDMQHEIQQCRRARGHVAFTQDEQHALCILEQARYQCEHAFARARAEAMLLAELKSYRNRCGYECR